MMIIFSTVLVILFIAAPNADAQRCNRWNTCYKQVQQQENSILQESVTEMNRTLLNQIELLEQQKDEMNKTFLNQTKHLQFELSRIVAGLGIYETLLLEQIEYQRMTKNVLQQQAKQISFYSEITRLLSECRLPKIEYLSTRRKIQHDSTVHLQCSNLVYRGVKNRTCKLGKIRPNFETHPFSCDTFYATWDEANKFCTDLGTTLISDETDTTEKRKEACRNYGVTDWLWTGITKSSGEWTYPNGGSLNGFHYDWVPGYPKTDNGWDFMVISCFEDSDFGKIFNNLKTDSFKFMCTK